jgi:hypothetical protein
MKNKIIFSLLFSLGYSCSINAATVSFDNTFMGIQSCIEEGEMEDCDKEKYGKRKENVAVIIDGKMKVVDISKIDKSKIDSNIFKRNLKLTGELKDDVLVLSDVIYVEPKTDKLPDGKKSGGCKK